MIGYACILVLITERGLPFPAAKRLALCGGEEACPLPRCRGSAFVLGEGKCLALRCGLLSVAAHCGKEERVVDVDEMTRGRSALAVTFDQDVFFDFMHTCKFCVYWLSSTKALPELRWEAGGIANRGLPVRLEALPHVEGQVERFFGW